MTLLALLSIVFSFLYTPPNDAEAPTVKVNSAVVAWTDAMPFIDENGRTMVPLRPVAEAMDATAEWFVESQTAVFTQTVEYVNYDRTHSITFEIGSPTAFITITKDYPEGFALEYPPVIVEMDTQPLLRDGRIYAPLRYLAEAFYFDVSWNERTNTASADFWPVDFYYTYSGNYDAFFTALYFPGETYKSFYHVEITDFAIDGVPTEAQALSGEALDAINREFGSDLYVFAFDVSGDYPPGEYHLTWTANYYVDNTGFPYSKEPVEYWYAYSGA